jgi:hypothetical protein
MTARTRRISQENLHERLAVEGPSDELRELGDTIDGLLSRLEAAFEAQRRFVANASHELRTPLARIRTALDVAVGKPEPVPPQVTVLDHKIREGLDRADKLLEGFLVLGRAEHADMPDTCVIALDELILAAIADHRGEIAGKQIEVEHDLCAATVIGSPALIGRMLDNVIENGVNHNVPNGWMRITLDNDPTRVRVTVTTSGEEFDPTRVRELGQPFRRLEADRTNSGNGTGLGLSIVAAIATAHSGSLNLRALDGGGLGVVIELSPAPHPARRRPAT